MQKKIQCYIKLQIFSGMANPSPPIGPALGQRGVNIMDFCKSFNNRTKNIDKGLPVSVIISVYSDKSFTFILKTPPVSFLLKKVLNIKLGSSNSKKNKIGKIKRDQIIDIVNIKSFDMTGLNIDAMIRSVIGTAYSMGIEVQL